MGILSRTGDLIYTFRFLKMLTTDFKKTDAFKLGIIDEKGKRDKSVPISTSEMKSAYTPFHKLVFNLKKILPGGKVSSYASALFLIKEKLDLSDKSLMKIIDEAGLDPLDFINESSEWFVLKDGMLSPGVYRVMENKMVNISCEEIVRSKDKVRILDEAYPVGDVFGLSIYEALHLNSNQKIYVTVGELVK